ncbi:hypothetical protein [Lactococcus termiticola]|uniref:Uncharacterized protein n=1 Tax=Lactococcus termiticola TaxID=2169526 RepID=A0A2R5HGF6_9LACT|nr:hypothetical protein [Lactococcus termiticola]GBG96936.1 hypothetical protein NtB2_01072 [Lactococcus termiticola]
MTKTKWTWEELEVKNMSEHVMTEGTEGWETVDDEPGAHKEHRRISRFGRTSHRFNQRKSGR